MGGATSEHLSVHRGPCAHPHLASQKHQALSKNFEGSTCDYHSKRVSLNDIPRDKDCVSMYSEKNKKFYPARALRALGLLLADSQNRNFFGGGSNGKVVAPVICSIDKNRDHYTKN